MNTQAACHTAQDITRMQAADKNMNNSTKHTWTEECVAEWTRDRTFTQWDRTWSVSVRTPTRNRNSRHECRDPNTTLQHETRYADERAHGSSALEAAQSRESRTWREYQGSVTKPWITLNRSYRTLTLLFIYIYVLIETADELKSCCLC